jgi:hypothetical protein
VRRQEVFPDDVRHRKSAGHSRKAGKFQGKCNNCGKAGHKVTDCWVLEENKHKLPNWNKNKEHANTAVNKGDAGPKVEILLCGMKFPQDQRMLNNPNMWIADSAATVHTTPHEMGMHKVK